MQAMDINSLARVPRLRELPTSSCQEPLPPRIIRVGTTLTLGQTVDGTRKSKDFIPSRPELMQGPPDSRVLPRRRRIQAMEWRLLHRAIRPVHLRSPAESLGVTVTPEF